MIAIGMAQSVSVVLVARRRWLVLGSLVAFLQQLASNVRYVCACIRCDVAGHDAFRLHPGVDGCKRCGSVHRDGGSWVSPWGAS